MKKNISVIFINVLAIVGVFIFIEGLSSTILFFGEFIKSKKDFEHTYTQYDKDLGWVNIPNIYIKDMYGPGKYLKTNSLGFRNSNEIGVNVPKDKLRIICSGDSFTLGYGVSNDNVWCQSLTEIDNRIESVNMGQDGYGVDQCYLRYKRDGVGLDHDVHIFAFITNDFLRMHSDKFLGHGKPVLELRENALFAKGIPVQKRSTYTAWIKKNQWKIMNLNCVKLVGSLIQKDQPPTSINMKQTTDQYHGIVSKIFSDLQKINQEKSSTLVLVYLPKKYYNDPVTIAWRKFLREETIKRGLIFFDLHDDYLKLPQSEVEKLFIKKSESDFDSAPGHYTEEGNAYIADVLYKKLLSIDEIATKLSKKQR